MKTKNTLKRFGLILLLLFVLSAGQDGAIAASEDSELPKLFEPVTAAPATLALQRTVTAPYIVQYQPAMVELDLLAMMEPEAKLNLNLLPETSFVGIVKRLEQREENCFTVAGYLENVPYGSFIIVVEEDVAVATIRAPSFSQLFSLRYAGSGIHLICQVDEAKFAPCGGGVSPPEAVAEATAEDSGLTEPEPISKDNISPLACTEPATVFDTMIVYSNLARQAAGGTTAIRALCQLAIEETNEAYDNSGIAARARLVYRGEVTYDEVGTYDDHLDRLTSTSDGVMDGIHSLRDTYRADFVSLWVNDPEYCGLGWCIANASKAFTIVTWDCATGGYSYAHEMGHNQGCDHDRDNGKAGCHLHSYSYGWRWWGDSGTRWRSVMSYSPGTRIQYFSNPNVSFDGQPTGVAIGEADEAYNARTINLRRSTCEGFRTTRFDIWTDFSHFGSELGTFNNPYDTVAEGVNQVITGVGASELPNLWIKTGSTSETITITKPMTIRACGGTVSIGG